MPRPGEIDLTYPNKLQQIGISLCEPFKGTKQYHLCECNICKHKWNTKPLTITQLHRRHETNSCPRCKQQRIDAQNLITRQQNKDFLTKQGLLYPDWWDGRRVLDGNNTPIHLPVTQIKCGHSFIGTVTNLLTRGIICSVCGIEERTSNINKSSKDRSDIWKETADIWQMYKSKVTKLSRISYKNNKDKINPNNLPTGRAGTEGAYHIDHIVPMRYCFINHIPEEICAHPDNLQMLGWRDNVGSRDKLKEYVPSVFHKYIITTNNIQ